MTIAGTIKKTTLVLAGLLAAGGPAAAADILWQGEAVVIRQVGCGGLGPIGQPGSRFQASLNPKLDASEANTSLVLTHPDQTIVFAYDRDDGSIFGQGTVVSPDGSVRKQAALMFIGNIRSLKTEDLYFTGPGILYNFRKRACNLLLNMALIRKP